MAYMLFANDIRAQTALVKTIQWKIAGRLPGINGQEKSLGFAGAVSGVNNNRLIIAGGANFPDSMPWMGGKKKYYDDIYVLKKNGRQLVNTGKQFRLPFPLAYAAVCSTSQGIVSAGGENSNGISGKVLLISWENKTGTIIITTLPDLPFAVTNASICARGNQVYLAGGEMENGVSNQFITLDLANIKAGWKSLPSLPKPLSHSVTGVQFNGQHYCVYLAGGRKKNPGAISDFSDALYRYDPQTKKWVEKNSLPYPLSAGAGLSIGSGSLLLFGGDKGETFHKTESLILAISAEKDEIRKKELIQIKNEVQSTHPGFSREVLLYDTIRDKWTSLGCVPFDMPVTTTAVNWGGSVIIPGGEIRAGVRTPDLLMGKILFK